MNIKKDMIPTYIIVCVYLLILLIKKNIVHCCVFTDKIINKTISLRIAVFGCTTGNKLTIIIFFGGGVR